MGEEKKNEKQIRLVLFILSELIMRQTTSNQSVI